MESLRKQLHETQGALHEKAALFRKLKVEQAEAVATWQADKQVYEAKIRNLEAENQRLRLLKKDRLQDERKSPIPDRPVLGGDAETVVFTRSQMREADFKYRYIKDQLAEKTKLCEDLERQLQAQGGGLRAAILPADLSEDQVVASWKKLGEQIRDLSTKKFNIPQMISTSEEQGYVQLSTHWRAYISRIDLSGYLMQALLWRCLYTSLFEKYCRVWGREYGNTAAKLGGFFMNKVSDAEFQNWRMLTGAMFDKACEIDATVVNDTEIRTYETVSRFTTGTESEAIKKALHEIITTAVELSVIFARSQFVPLMADKPGSILTRGFAVQEATMEVKGKYGAGTAVDLMVSPCLLKKDADYSVLVKAEVIC
ncbi:hypothetical protein F4818DRAFT_413382 [Hypoxylon cercidicola]|nr:hypothetical protein F4818DRAFT_413382 [Hypoxylon cercidicola]